MLTDEDRKFGGYIARVIQKADLTREEAREAFTAVITERTTEMQQGALLAALTAKGETAHEVAGAWEAIYDLDTRRISIDDPDDLVENSGTGMDTFKTFNISTAASVLAAAGGIRMARHGARAITSVCGTVDMAEALGVDVECPVETVAASIRKSRIGLFNGMSAQVHPRALGRILSRIAFGSTLNIAASLANPVMPPLAVRGVYDREQILPVAQVMKAVGYRRAVVLHGSIDHSTRGMDEASVCGTTYCAELEPDGGIREYSFRPEDFGLSVWAPDPLSPSGDVACEAGRLIDLLRGKLEGARLHAVLLNAGLVFYVANRAANITEGIAQAAASISNGAAWKTLEEWVAWQNRNPRQGLERLRSVAASRQ